MTAHLLSRESEIDWQWIGKAVAVRSAERGTWQRRDPTFDIKSGLPWNFESLTADLSLEVLLDAMARDDGYVLEASRYVLLRGVRSGTEEVRYRQEILKECLERPVTVRELYAISVEAEEKRKGHYLGSLTRFPDAVLRESAQMMGEYLGLLKRLSAIADSDGRNFVSEGWSRFFKMLRKELGAGYLAEVENHLKELRSQTEALLLSAELGEGGKGDGYILHQAPHQGPAWWTKIAALVSPQKADAYRFGIHPRDEAGMRALADLRDRGLILAANALFRSAVHVGNFFESLRAELAFYVGCVNLTDRFAAVGKHICFPQPEPPEECALSFTGLYDATLALTIGEAVVGNDAAADGKPLVVVTGANTGGKSTFLRSVGLAQLMMQAGMYVPAESFRASLYRGFFTHYKREEDVTMDSGKFDEELRRMSEIVDRLESGSLVLLNESFASTNEREGSEVGRQIVEAMLDSGVRVMCVTHLYELARGFYESRFADTLFLQAERTESGARTFKLVVGKPLPTSYGRDIYERYFGAVP